MKTKIKLLKASNAVIAGILAVLGFASCNDINIFTTRPEYGTPSAKFIVNGNVSSEKTQQALKNIRVVMTDTFRYSHYYSRVDTTFTDDKGNYQLEKEGFPGQPAFLIQFHDAEDRYTSLDTIIAFENPQFTGGSRWYEGEASKKLDVKLATKDDSN